MLSKRLPVDLRPNALARAREARGGVPFDLTVSNPTVCGIPYPDDILDDLADRAARTYRPEPLGLPEARAAVAAHYGHGGIDVDPDRVVLTASTSEAYGLALKLLCDPGDVVLVPVPSYPLLHHLVTLEGLSPVPYELPLDEAWQPDARALAHRPARAILTVHPNNPTGSFLTRATADALVDACAGSGKALVADEVFLDYRLDGGAAAPSFAGETRALTFCLGGLSKLVGLPQLKLAWIVVSGPEAEARPALDGLAFIADQYLSVSTPVQLALPRLFERGAAVRAAILARCRRNLTTLVQAVAATGSVTVLAPQGGWCAILRVPAVHDDETLALALLEQDGVAVHPGYLFDFPAQGSS